MLMAGTYPGTEEQMPKAFVQTVTNQNKRAETQAN